LGSFISKAAEQQRYVSKGASVVEYALLATAVGAVVVLLAVVLTSRATSDFKTACDGFRTAGGPAAGTASADCGS
jgi:Flp pilus assembly pilin Flp